MVKAGFLPWQNVLTRVSEGVDRRILWMRSGGQREFSTQTVGRNWLVINWCSQMGEKIPAMQGLFNARPAASGAIAFYTCSTVLRCWRKEHFPHFERGSWWSPVDGVSASLSVLSNFIWLKTWELMQRIKENKIVCWVLLTGAAQAWSWGIAWSDCIFSEKTFKVVV